MVLVTSGRPSRVRMLPRGGWVTIVRRRLLSARAAYCSPLMTCRNQSRMSSRPSIAIAMPPRMAMRTAIFGVSAGAQPPAGRLGPRPERERRGG